MKKTFFKFLLFIFVTIFFYSTASAATVNVVTKYWKTWSLKWALNTVWNLVNGINTCPQANTNANATPWCDMSSDAWTPSDWSDDSYSWDISVSIASQNATQVTDDTNNTSLKVTASPHWNLQKRG